MQELTGSDATRTAGSGSWACGDSAIDDGGTRAVTLTGTGEAVLPGSGKLVVATLSLFPAIEDRSGRPIGVVRPQRVLGIEPGRDVSREPVVTLF